MNTILKRKYIFSLTVFLSLVVTSCFSFATKKNTSADPVVVSAPQDTPAEKNETSDAVEFRNILMATDTHLASIQDICQHMRKLAVRSANGIYTPKDREMLNAEFQQMIHEILRIRKYARYQGKKLIYKSQPQKKKYHRLAFTDHSIEAVPPVLPFRYFVKSNLSHGTDILSSAGSNSAIGILDGELSTVCQERARILGTCNRVTFIIELKKKLHDRKLAVK